MFEIFGGEQIEEYLLFCPFNFYSYSSSSRPCNPFVVKLFFGNYGGKECLFNSHEHEIVFLLFGVSGLKVF
jgi:hypothetical protein